MFNLEYRNQPEPSSSTGHKFTREMINSLPRIEAPPPREVSMEAYVKAEIEKAVRETRLIYQSQLEEVSVLEKRLKKANRAPPLPEREKDHLRAVFMKEGEAAAFRTNWLENRVNAQQLGLDIDHTYRSWLYFADKMEERFKDNFEKESAKNEILTLKQGAETAQVFFEKFKEK
ncbi:hypothetical protein SERLADRAFT_440823 [Serpula lacrymans var. lacrymans S7.9]|uniref:Retrotransposon gag domain-containing protein n=1 Tax=Serpula lacrymans var. lacrymans (strain S7.9) TaxID=578457 RepID=F8P4M7_SERL9|nr:uncharacterized protein SERLADRAFT_440823 [Serpula lacrymans var. lacrymans S7.9]EGO21564.1 hypothetical protein SERLADRAFT_440823 [Serpula lacrymans var. lacrymans S7.9]